MNTVAVAEFARERLVSLLSYGDRIALRHDVDYDPLCAEYMAELEHGHGVRSTFYFMVRGPYNVFGFDCDRIIRRITSLGHSVGVHVDLNLPRDAQPPDWLIEKTATAQYRLLNVGYPWIERKVSFHAPPHAVAWRHVAGFDHALSPQWRGLYLADSRGVWRENPEDFIESLLRDGHRPQLNLHPEWWFWPVEKADEWRQIEAAKP